MWSDARDTVVPAKVTELDAQNLPVGAYFLRVSTIDDDKFEAEVTAAAAKLAKAPTYASPKDVPFSILLPAFVTSELKTAFEIGFILFVPFLIIDLIVASILMSLGMMMVPPTTISLPLKILLFVMVNGWGLLVQGLVQSVR